MNRDRETRSGPGAPEREFGDRRRPSLGSLLRRAARAERRHAAAWLIAGIVTTAGTVLLGSAEDAAFPAVLGLLLSVHSARQVMGIQLARRDLQSADTPPRRAYVVLLDDPNPRVVRPLLAVWPQAAPPGARPPKPDSVWRCDDELDELMSFQGSIEVHEAWLDRGPRSWSKPRWVRADAGIALPHRRAWLGRWYLNLLLRRDRRAKPRRLTIDDPHTMPDTGDELPLKGSLLRSVVEQGVALVALTLAALWLS